MGKVFMDKKNIKIVYQYDGSKFFGFQRQRNLKTVQGEIERTIKKGFGEEVNMISSGRTDKGVHALGQVSNFFISKNIPLESVKRFLNRQLKGEIKILDIEEMEENFNARYDAKKRSYLYIMKKEEEISPFEFNYVTGIKKDIDINKIQEIMNVYIGKHNFKNFMKSDRAYRNPVRDIEYIKCDYNKNEKRYYIEICGNSFLKTMIRIMIGTALEVYYNGKSNEYIKRRLLGENENERKILAPSEGLYLYNIEY